MSKSTKLRLQFISEGGCVERYHTRPGIKPDTDARHSHGVAMLCSILAGEGPSGFTKASPTLLMAALTHDLAEQYASDVSANTKRILGLGDVLEKAERFVLSEYGLDYQSLLTDDERVVLKLADQFDCLLYCTRELALGNKRMKVIWNRTCGAVEKFAADLPIEIALRAADVYDSIKEIYHEVTGEGGPAFDVYEQGGYHA